MKLSREVAFATKLEPSVVLGRLRESFAKEHLPVNHSPLGEPVAIGIFDGASVTLKIIDTRKAGLAPAFRGEIQSENAETRIVGAIGYDAPTATLVALIGGSFLIAVTAMLWSSLHSVPFVGAIVAGIACYLVGVLASAQVTLANQLKERVAEAIRE